MKTNKHFNLMSLIIYNKMSRRKVVEETETHILCPIIFFFQELCHLWGNVEEYCAVGQTTDYSIAQAHCVLGT